MSPDDPPDDFWEWSFALDPATPVRAVSAAGGLVVAAGDALHMLRPGAQRLRSRDLPADFGVNAVAAEPWSPFRVAIASHTRVGIYTGHRPYDPVVDLRFSGPEFDATHLAWVRHDGESMLYLRQRGGEVSRIREGGTSENLTCPNAAAIASDAKGVFGLITLVPADSAEVWLLPEGAKAWDTRIMTTIPVGDDAKDWLVHLAVRGPAVAWSMDDWSANVSWEEHEDEDEHFDSPPGVFYGPIAFQSEGVIFAAYNVEGQVRVLRHVRHGGVTRIARFGVGEDWEGIPATVTGLAWDDERRVLWAASPELGLIRLTEPSAAERKKKILLS
jgi:hypothetical protein